MSTSRNAAHLTSDDRPVASCQASWDELTALVGVLGEYDGDRIFELAFEDAASDPDSDVREAAYARMRKLALSSNAAITFGAIAFNEYRWRASLDLVDSVNAAGGRAFGQSVPRALTSIFSFKTRLPFDRIPQWAEFRSLALDAQRKRLEDPEDRLSS